MKQRQYCTQRESLFETALCLTEQEETKTVQNLIQKMAVFPLGFGEYELFYHINRNEIIIKPVVTREKNSRYFMSKDDAYACILLIGESRLKNYLKLKGKIC